MSFVIFCSHHHCLMSNSLTPYFRISIKFWVWIETIILLSWKMNATTDEWKWQKTLIWFSEWSNVHYQTTKARITYCNISISQIYWHLLCQYHEIGFSLPWCISRYMRLYIPQYMNMVNYLFGYRYYLVASPYLYNQNSFFVIIFLFKQIWKKHPKIFNNLLKCRKSRHNLLALQ